MTQMPTAWQKRWRLDAEQGRYRLVPGDRVTAHVRALLADGVSMRGIAAAAGVSTSTVLRFRDEHYPTTRRSVARRVLAVRRQDILGRPDGDGFVPNIGARRRIRALLAIGWTHATISAHMTNTGQSSQRVLHQEGRYITKAAHDAVCAAYASLSMRPGPSATTRRRAASSGYAPPLAWDDEDIDDPAALPHTDDAATGADWLVVELVCSGRPMDTTTADRELIVPFLAARGMSDGAIAALCHTTDRTIFRTRGRLDIESRWSA